MRHFAWSSAVPKQIGASGAEGSAAHPTPCHDRTTGTSRLLTGTGACGAEGNVAHLILSRTATGSSVRFAAAFACAFLARQGACQAAPALAGAAEVCADRYPNPRQAPKPASAARSLSSALSAEMADGLDLAAPPSAASGLRVASAGGSLPPPRSARGEAHGHAGADLSLTPVLRQCAPLCACLCRGLG